MSPPRRRIRVLVSAVAAPATRLERRIDWRCAISVVTISAITANIGGYVAHSDVKRDMLGDISFDSARWQALEVADYMRRMGLFESGQLPMEDMEYTTMPAVAERPQERWEAIDEPAPVPAWR
jgi:fructose 1,6-bisphosphatase